MKRAWKAPRQVRQREATGAAGAGVAITAAAIGDVMGAFFVNRFCFESVTLYPNCTNR